jgi:hypothetical protein
MIAKESASNSIYPDGVNPTSGIRFLPSAFVFQFRISGE